MREILFTAIALLGLAGPAPAGQDSGNSGPTGQGPFTSASYDAHWDVTNHGAFASQDSGNLPDTLHADA